MAKKNYNDNPTKETNNNRYNRVNLLFTNFSINNKGFGYRIVKQLA